MVTVPVCALGQAVPRRQRSRGCACVVGREGVGEKEEGSGGEEGKEWVASRCHWLQY